MYGLYEIKKLSHAAIAAMGDIIITPQTSTITVLLEKIHAISINELQKLERDENIIDSNPRPPIVKDIKNENSPIIEENINQ